MEKYIRTFKLPLDPIEHLTEVEKNHSFFLSLMFLELYKPFKLRLKCYYSLVFMISITLFIVYTIIWYEFDVGITTTSFFGLSIQVGIFSGDI